MDQNAQSPRRLTRSRQGMIAGVCAGLSEYSGLNLIFIRIVFMVLGLANGIGLVLYIILLIAIPASPLAEASTGAFPAPQRSRKTFFAYIAATVSACAALLSFFSDVSSIFEAAEKLLSSSYSEPAAPVIREQSKPISSPPWAETINRPDMPGDRSLPFPQPPRLYCCDEFGNRWCPIVVDPGPPGTPCWCVGLSGFGIMCQ